MYGSAVQGAHLAGWTDGKGLKALVGDASDVRDARHIAASEVVDVEVPPPARRHDL